MNPNNPSEVQARQAEALALLMQAMKRMMIYDRFAHTDEQSEGYIRKDAAATLARAEALLAPDQPEGEPIAWTGNSALSLPGFPYTPLPFIEGHPEKGWALYTSDQYGLWQRTRPILPPFEGAFPQKHDGVWRWMRPA